MVTCACTECAPYRHSHNTSIPTLLLAARAIMAAALIRMTAVLILSMPSPLHLSTEWLHLCLQGIPGKQGQVGDQAVGSEGDAAGRQ